MIDEMRVSYGFPLRVAIHTDVGRVRTNNEDSHGFAWLPDSSLFVIVADGMGGHEAGEVASGLAVQVLEEVVARDLDADPRERLYNGLLEANEAILQEGRASGTRGMGTTAIAMVCRGSEVFAAMVGDSRLYLVRRGHLVWRTLDHTRVQMLIDQGTVPEQDARAHPESGMLTRALGHAKMADGRPLVPDVLGEPIRLPRDDAVVMCSDGLHDLVEDWEIGRTVAGREPAAAVAELVRLAVERGGHDNVTVAVVTAGERSAEYDPAYVPVAPFSPTRTVPTVPPESIGAEPGPGDMIPTTTEVQLPPEYVQPPAPPVAEAPAEPVPLEADAVRQVRPGELTVWGWEMPPELAAPPPSPPEPAPPEPALPEPALPEPALPEPALPEPAAPPPAPEPASDAPPPLPADALVPPPLLPAASEAPPPPIAEAAPPLAAPSPVEVAPPAPPPPPAPDGAAAEATPMPAPLPSSVATLAVLPPPIERTAVTPAPLFKPANPPARTGARAPRPPPPARAAPPATSAPTVVLGVVFTLGVVAIALALLFAAIATGTAIWTY